MYTIGQKITFQGNDWLIKAVQIRTVDTAIITLIRLDTTSWELIEVQVASSDLESTSK